MKLYIWPDGTSATADDIGECKHMSDDYFTLDTEKFSWSEAVALIRSHFDTDVGTQCEGLVQEIREYYQ